jgi:4-amino-4-deoxy-L-arabinose transferase-like glycosyltransferase
VPVLLIGFFPWSALLPSALWRQYRRWKERGRSAVRGDVNLFAALWCSAVFVFFSLGATRLPHYIGPLFPSAALLAGAYLAHAVREPASGFRTAVRLMVGTGLAVAAFFAAGPIVFGLFADKLAKTFPYAAQFRFGAAPYLAAAVVVIGMALVIYAAGQSDRRPLMFWGAGGSAAIVLLLLFTLILPELSRYMLAPPQDLAALAGRQLRPRDHLIVYGLTRPSTVFYAQRKIIPVGKNEEQNIVPYLSDGGRTMIVMPEALRDRLPPEAARLPVVAERYGWILLAADPVIPARSPTSAGRLPSS